MEDFLVGTVEKIKIFDEFEMFDGCFYMTNKSNLATACPSQNPVGGLESSN